MSRAAVRNLVLPLLVAAALLAPATASAAPGAAVFAPAGFEMTRSIQLSFKRLQELWLQWLGASLQDNPARAGETLRSLQATARQLGFVRLPELALGATARARQAAGEGDFARARRALDAAEALDPGRSDVAFAAARVAWQQGDQLGAVSNLAGGFARLFSLPERSAVMRRVALWSLAALLLGAALYLAAVALARGGAAYRNLHAALARRIPAAVAHVLAVALLLGPFAVPGGLAVGLLIWTVVLWRQASASERGVLAGIWLVLALAPPAADRIVRQLTIAHSPPMRALDDFEQGRLSGNLFTDLAVLRSALPDSAAALELSADVHRTLGQWEIARGLYRQVQARESGFSAALLNLGADAFRKGDFAAANGYFKRAAESEGSSAAAWYNLSLSYSESYLFEDAKVALERARQIDGAQVDRWIQVPNPDRVLTFNGGLARREEIARQLTEVWSAGTGEQGRAGRRAGRWLPGIAVAVAALAALLLGGIRPAGRSPVRGGLDLMSAHAAALLRRLLPAVALAEAGRGPAALLHGLLIAALLTLPRLAHLGGDFAASANLDRAAGVTALLGLAVYLTWILRRVLARRAA